MARKSGQGSEEPLLDNQKIKCYSRVVPSLAESYEESREREMPSFTLEA